MEIKKIVIAGAGYSMADIFAKYGYDVVLYNHRQETLDKAKTKISEDSREKIAYTVDMQAFEILIRSLPSIKNLINMSKTRPSSQPIHQDYPSTSSLKLSVIQNALLAFTGLIHQHSFS